MSLRFGAGQKAAARALLDLQAPTRSLIAACMGTTERSVTDWITRYHWSYVDFRPADARDSQDRHRRGLMRGHGRNVAPASADLDYHEAVLAQERAAAKAEDDRRRAARVAPALEGEAGDLLAELRTQMRLLSGRLMHQYSRRGRALGLDSVEAAEVLVGLGERLERALRDAFDDRAPPSPGDFELNPDAVDDAAIERAVAMLGEAAALRGYAEGLDDEELAAAYGKVADLLEAQRG